MVSLTAKEAFELASNSLVGRGMPKNVADKIAEEVVIAELEGVKTHGLGKIASLNLGDIGVEPNIEGAGPIFSVNGNGGNGFIIFDEISDVLVERCKQFGIAAAFITNTSRYSSLYPYTTKLAKKGYVAFLANTAGPAAVAPYGSVDPITGTNPLCFSFPKDDGAVQSFDFATSGLVWGEIRQAALEGRQLPFGPFINAKGDITTDPEDVNAVNSFGGVKGWVLNLAIEVIAGLLTSGKAGTTCESEYDCGAIFLAINPEALGIKLSDFTSNLEFLFKSIREARPENRTKAVRVPGDRGRNSIVLANRWDEKIELPDVLPEMLQRMADGKDVSELSSNPLFN